MTINRASIAKQLLPGLNKIFQLTYGKIDGEHAALFTTENSGRAFEEETAMVLFGTAPTKSEGAAVQFDEATEGYTSRYEHETIALAFAITEEALEDNLYDTFAKVRAKGLARSMANTKQVKAANIFNLGFSTNLGDGVPFFSASHPTYGDGNQSNTVSSDLSEAALETALIAIARFKDERGIYIGSMGRSLHIPKDLCFVAERILRSPLRVGTADNDVNAIKNMGLLPGGFYVNHRFTDTDAWFIKTDVDDGAKHFVRVPMSTKMDVDFDTGNIRYKARERYSFGVSDWRSFYGSNGA